MHVFDELRREAQRHESEFTQPPGAERYRAFDAWAVELEVAEFLYGLVRVLKPLCLLESGAGKGYSTLALAAAVEANGVGEVIAFEPNPDYRKLAQERVANYARCEVRVGNTFAWPLSYHCVDFVFLDSYPRRVRDIEINHWLSANVSLVIHDAHRYPGLTGGTYYPCPRGLWVRIKS